MIACFMVLARCQYQGAVWEDMAHMDIESYEKEGRSTYARFANAVAGILLAALKRDGGYRLQQIAHRAKASDSLRRKLQQRGVEDTARIELAAKDLAGCRIVFYTDSDVDHFARSGLLRDNFAIDWEQTRFHHPTQSGAEAIDLFRSINYVVRLSDDRARLAEYGEYADLLCEVQVQTSLNHAWSEMAHDMIYKKPDLKGFGEKQLKSIEARMADIMRKYLEPAGYEFQKVVSDFERLASGKKLFDEGPFEALGKSTSNNERYEILQRFRDYLLPLYDDHRAVQHEIRSAMAAAIAAARLTAVQPIETPYGAMRGFTSTQVIDLALHVVDAISHIDPDSVVKTADLLISLYPAASNEVERKHFKQSAQHLAKHDRTVWLNAGPIVQSVLAERLTEVDVQSLLAAEEVSLALLGAILQPEIEGTSSTYATVTLHVGHVVASDALKAARSKALNVLESMFKVAADESGQRRIWQVIQSATQLPTRGQSRDELTLMVVDDSVRAVDFISQFASTMSYEFRQSVEHDLLWQHRHNVGSENEAPTLREARHKLARSIHVFRDAVNADSTFTIYKTLVGFESVFPPAWDDRNFGYAEIEEYRSERIGEYVSKISEANQSEWLQTLELCAQTQSNDLATWPTFVAFLQRLASSHPAIGLAFAQRAGPDFARFVPALLMGLEDTTQAEQAQSIMKGWIAEGSRLAPVLHFQTVAKLPNKDLIEAAFQQAVRLQDDSAVLRSIEASCTRHADVGGGLLVSVFMPALKYMTERGSTAWVRGLRPVPSKCAMFMELNDEQAGIVFDALVAFPRIDYEVEDLLSVISAGRPQRLVEFFAQRMQHERSADDRYEDVPFKFWKLHEILATVPDHLLASAKKWRETDGPLFAYRGGRLIAQAFPSVTPELEQRLLAFVHSGDRAAIELVVGILHNYEGQQFGHRVLQAVVEVLEPNDSLLSEVRIALEQMGVVRGEFGTVEAYKQKREDVRPWLNDGRRRVVQFADSYIRELDNLIASEQRRAENDLQMRKREYGAGEEDRNDGD